MRNKQLLDEPKWQILLIPRIRRGGWPVRSWLVVERKRLASERDGLMWYCPACNHLLYEEFFALEDIERDLPPVFERFFMGLWSGGLVRFVGLCILGGLDGLVFACGVRGLEPFGTRREYVLVG